MFFILYVIISGVYYVVFFITYIVLLRGYSAIFISHMRYYSGISFSLCYHVYDMHFGVMQVFYITLLIFYSPVFPCFTSYIWYFIRSSFPDYLSYIRYFALLGSSCFISHTRLYFYLRQQAILAILYHISDLFLHLSRFALYHIPDTFYLVPHDGLYHIRDFIVASRSYTLYHVFDILFRFWSGFCSFFYHVCDLSGPFSFFAGIARREFERYFQNVSALSSLSSIQDGYWSYACRISCALPDCVSFYRITFPVRLSIDHCGAILMDDFWMVLCSVVFFFMGCRNGDRLFAGARRKEDIIQWNIRGAVQEVLIILSGLFWNHFSMVFVSGFY